MHIYTYIYIYTYIKTYVDEALDMSPGCMGRDLFLFWRVVPGGGGGRDRGHVDAVRLDAERLVHHRRVRPLPFRLLITEFIQEVSLLLPYSRHLQDFDRSMFPLSLVPRDVCGKMCFSF